MIWWSLKDSKQPEEGIPDTERVRARGEQWSTKIDLCLKSKQGVKFT